VAGPVANFILAFVLMAGLYMYDNQVPAFVTQPAVADFVAPDSPVGRTGIQSGDRIVHFDTIENPTWGDLEQRGGLDSNQDAAFSPKDVMLAIDGLHLHSVDALLAYLQDRAGKPSVVTLERQDASGTQAQLAVPIQPYYGDGQRGKMWMMGFQAVPPPTTAKQLPFGEAVAASWTDNLKNSKLIFDVLHRLFTRQVSVKSLSSPVGMAVQVNEAFEAPGSFPIIATMAMISLNLGIFNLLPIPILDGGMILFLAIESLMRRDLNQAVKERVYQVAFVCLVLFAAVVIFNDITKLLPAHLKT
jgi:regulator of sigma E protease